MTDREDSTDLALLLKGYGLTTARFFYRFPDHPLVLNTFTWQFYDLQPDYPKLFDFIAFWQRSLDGPLHSVSFAHSRLLAPGSWRQVVHEMAIEPVQKGSA